MPVATNGCDEPFATEAKAGLTVMPVNCGGPTVNVAVPITPANVAETVVAPWATELANPEELSVAIPVGEELQVAAALKSFVLPSL